MSALLEVIAVIRDIVIILSALIITTVVVIVGRVILDLTQKAEEVRSFFAGMVTAVTNPIKGALLAVGLIRRR